MFDAHLLLLKADCEPLEQLVGLLSERGYQLTLLESERLLSSLAPITADLLLLSTHNPLADRVQQWAHQRQMPMMTVDIHAVIQDPVRFYVELELNLRNHDNLSRVPVLRMRDLLEHLADILIVLNPDGSPRYLSPATERITGYRPEELIECGLTHFLHPEDQQKVSEAMHWSREHPGRPILFDYRHIHKLGGYVQLQSVAQSLLDVPGIQAFVIISRDVSERTALEAQIHYSEQRYRIIAEQTGQMVYDWNVMNGEIEWVGAIEEITGYSSHEYQAVDIECWKSMIHEADRAHTLCLIERAIHENTRFSTEYRLRRKDGSYVWIEDTGLFLRNEQGQAVRMLGSMKDVSQRRINAMLLQSALNEREILLQEIHHRVKNNFQIIISLLNMQIRRLQQEDARLPLLDIRNRLHSMLLIHEKLYRRGQATEVLFNEYLEILGAELLAQYQVDHSVSLDFGLQPLLLPVEQAIPCGLIANELLTNALKYAFTDSTVYTRPQISVRLCSEVGQIQLEIADNGCGLPDTAHIGLGLHLVQRLAQQLGGTCERQPTAEGTCWQLRFPFNAETKSDARTAYPGNRMQATFEEE